MSSDSASEAPAGEEIPARALAQLRELSPDILAAAVLSSDGNPIAADPPAAWQGPVVALWKAADAAGADARQVHIGTEDGEVFAVRDQSRAVVAVSRRFALASLMFCDLRSLLRDLDRELPG